MLFYALASNQVMFVHHHNKVKSFLLVYEAVKTTFNDQMGWRGYKRRINWLRNFNVGRCVLREWVVSGGGLDGCFREHGEPVGVQECLERFHRGGVDYLSR